MNPLISSLLPNSSRNLSSSQYLGPPSIPSLQLSLSIWPWPAFSHTPHPTFRKPVGAAEHPKEAFKKESHCPLETSWWLLTQAEEKPKSSIRSAMICIPALNCFSHSVSSCSSPRSPCARYRQLPAFSEHSKCAPASRVLRLLFPLIWMIYPRELHATFSQFLHISAEMSPDHWGLPWPSYVIEWAFSSTPNGMPHLLYLASLSPQPLSWLVLLCIYTLLLSTISRMEKLWGRRTLTVSPAVK